MTKRINSEMAGLARIICCCAAILSGCANLAPTAETSSAPASDSLPSLRILESRAKPDAKSGPRQTTTLADTLPKVEISDQPSLPQAIDLTADQVDLFQRLRHGYAMPDLNDDLVLHHQQWYMNRPDYLRRMIDRSSRLIAVYDEHSRIHSGTWRALCYARKKQLGIRQIRWMEYL